MSNRIKFMHVVTGTIQVIPLKAGIAHIMDQSGKPSLRVGSIEKLVTHMNKNGFIRTGKRQQLNNVEKALLKEAPKLIAELKSRQAAAISKAIGQEVEADL